ncbi:unnamed protein product [Lepeophtheirus salmonis]|uniref:(salmon louse) hypothetical protein n=1 Tax=Lepeophtheirus salmonis TaxID=72036 RepID=A0A7R8CZ29_LEPSM|nr:unnamed protein product [Lepeophtheirus salmonis]CAF2946603.1 unnamed protein product [Lepeophtheirus salmonis]
MWNKTRQGGRDSMLPYYAAADGVVIIQSRKINSSSFRTPHAEEKKRKESANNVDSDGGRNDLPSRKTGCRRTPQKVDWKWLLDSDLLHYYRHHQHQPHHHHLRHH